MTQIKKLKPEHFYVIEDILYSETRDALNTFSEHKEFIRTWRAARYSYFYKEFLPIFLSGLAHNDPEGELSNLNELIPIAVAMAVEMTVNADIICDYYDKNEIINSSLVSELMSIFEKILPSFKDTIKTFRHILPKYIKKIITVIKQDLVD